MGASIYDRLNKYKHNNGKTEEGTTVPSSVSNNAPEQKVNQKISDRLDKLKNTQQITRPSLNPAQYDDSWKKSNDVSDFDFSGTDLVLDNTTDYNRLANLKLAAEREAENNKYATTALGGGGKSTAAKTSYEAYLAEHTVKPTFGPMVADRDSLVYQMLKDRAEAEKARKELPVSQQLGILQNQMQAGKTDFGGVVKAVSGTPAQDAFDDYRKRFTDYNEYLSAPDFAEYSKKGAEIQNPTFEAAQGGANLFGWRPGADEVGNIVTFSRENSDKINEKLSSDDKSNYVGNVIYNYMYDKEVGIYNYLLAKEGKEAAQIYLDSITEELNKRHGKEAAKTVESARGTPLHPVMVAGAATSAGLDQYASGVKQAFNEYELPTSGTQFMGQAVREDQGTVGKFAYDAISTLSNMAPSILASYVAMGLGVPAKAAEWVAAGSIGLGSGGNAYKQALAEGRSKDEAKNVAFLTGASEAVLGKLLSGISAVGGLAPKKLLPKVAAIEKSIWRVAAAAGIKIGGEVSEELLQLYLEPLYKTLIYGDKYDAPTVEEVAYTALLTMVTTGLVEGGEIAKYRTKDGAAAAVRAELQNDAQSVPAVVSDGGNVPGGERAQNAPAASQTEQKKASTGLRDPMQVLMEENQKKQAQQNEKTAAETQRNVFESNTEAKAPGFYKNDRFGGTEDDAVYLDRLAKAAGISIEMSEARDGSNGWIVNGEVHLSENAEDPLRVVAKHEITHHLQDAAGEAYGQFRNYVEEIYRSRGTLDQQIDAIQKLYRENGEELTWDGAMDELAADYAGELLDNEVLIRRLAGENRNLAQRILDGIRDLIRRVKTAFGGDEVKQLDRAARLWEDALRETNEAYQRGEVAVNPNVRWSAANEYDPEAASIKKQLEHSQEMLNGMDVVVRLEVPTNLNSKKEATRWAVELLAHTNYQVDTKDFGVIRFNKDDINDAMNYADTPEEKAAIAALPRVLKRGVEIGRHENHKGRNKQTITIAAPVELNGQRGNMAVVISQYKNHYETHRIVLPDGSAFKFSDKKTDTTQEPSRGVTVSGSLAKTTSVVSGESVSQNRKSVKGSRDMQKKIDALERQNQRLKEQMKRTDVPKKNRAAVRMVATDLKQEFGSEIDEKVLTDQLDVLYQSMHAKGGSAYGKESEKNKPFAKIQEEARSIAMEILDQSKADVGPLGNDFRGLRIKIRNEELTIAEKDRAELRRFGYDGYEDFKARNSGRIKLVEDGRSVESLYRELNEEYPDLFPDDMFTAAEQLVRIGDVLQDVESIAENPKVYDRKNLMADQLAGEILERFYQTPRKNPTWADKQYQKLQQQRVRDLRSLRAEAKAYRAQREQDVKKLREQYAKQNDERIENQNAAQRRKTIYQHAFRLGKKMIRPTNKQHVPEGLRGAAYHLLEYINLESGFEYAPKEDGRYHRVIAGSIPGAKPANRTMAALALKEQLKKAVENETLTVDPMLDENVQKIAGMGGKTLQEMSREELDTVWIVLKSVERMIVNANELHNGGRFEKVSKMAEAIKAFVDPQKQRVTFSDKGVGAVLNNADRRINFDMLEPETLLHRLGPAGDEIYRMMRKSHDQETAIISEGTELAAKLIKESGVDFSRLDKELHRFDFGGKRKLTLSTSQIMELYALMKRPQARAHILTGGLKSIGATDGPFGIFEIRNAEPVAVTATDVAQILNKLTDKQKELMDGLQKYLSTTLAEHGNAETMKVYGYKKFKETHYWPIKVAATENKSNPAGEAAAKMIPNFGMTKLPEPSSKQPVELQSALDSFDTHLSQMATYAAWLGTNDDITRLINYQFKEETDTTKNETTKEPEEDKKTPEVAGTVKRILESVYGVNGEKYLNNLLRDIAQGTKTGQDRSDAEASIGRWKGAKVGGNLRVIVQQPTAILRAMSVIDPKYMLTAGSAKKGWEKAKKYAPIAQWKDWGYFEIGTGRSIRELIVGTESTLDKWKNAGMWAAGAMDSLTWGHLWNSVENEIADKQPHLSKETKAFNEAVAERFSEIIDKTQVVDSVLHRTQVMRSGNALDKMATSFMSEPSKIYNMVARDVFDIVDARDEAEKKRAFKRLGRTAGALVSSFALNALMQSLIDALRDDDRDKGYWEKFAENYLGFTGDEKSVSENWESFWSGNFWQNFNPLSYVPYVKDVLSVIHGYGVDRSDMIAISDLINALQQLGKSISGEGKKTTPATSLEAAAKFGDFIGLPVSNIKREVTAMLNTILNGFELYDLQYKFDKLAYNEENAAGVFFGDLYRAMNNDYDAYEDIYDDMYEGMIERGYEKDEAADKISDAMENKMKKDLGVESVKSMPVRYSSPTIANKEDPFYALLKKARENDTNWVEALDPGSIEIALAVDSIRDAKTLEKIRMVAEQPYGEDLKRLAMRNFMGDSQWGRYLSALNAGVSSKQFAEFLEEIAKEAQRRTGKEDANPSQADILAVLEKSKLNSKQKRAIWNGYGWKAESPW